MAHLNSIKTNSSIGNILACHPGNVAFSAQENHAAADWVNGRYAHPARRPQRPAVGPQARYTMISHDIGLGSSGVSVFFEDGKMAYEAGLEWTLYHLEHFDEPSRHIILASTAVHFGLPFDVLMGGML